MSLSHFNVPMLEPKDVIPHLGRGPAHWKVGRSAHALCVTWWNASGIPKPVVVALQTNAEFSDIALVDGIFERSVELGDGNRPSQTDLLAICADQSGLVAVAVEGKVDEPFGPLVSEWRDGSLTKENRLKMLCSQLGIGVDDVAGLRYQLLHRTVSAMIEASRYRTQRAILLVHSFCPRKTGFEDFCRFASAMKFAEPVPNAISVARKIGNISLFIGWVTDELPAA